jgi:hypothetical protein
MNVQSYTLDIDKFIEDFSSLIRSRDDRGTVLNDVTARIDVAKSSITTFLKETDSITDRDIRNCCRSAAIAQMYHIKPEYGGYPYIADQSDWVLLVQFKQYVDGRPLFSTAVVSKYGVVLTHEGGINHRGYNTGHGWVVKSIVTGKNGFISNYGDLLIPFIFDDCYLSDAYETWFFYNQISFELTVFGKQSNLSREYLEELINYSESANFIVGRSKEGTLYTLKIENCHRSLSSGHLILNSSFNGKRFSRADPVAFRKAFEDVTALMSPYTISTEELKKLLKP